MENVIHSPLLKQWIGSGARNQFVPIGPQLDAIFASYGGQIFLIIASN